MAEPKRLRSQSTQRGFITQWRTTRGRTSAPARNQPAGEFDHDAAPRLPVPFKFLGTDRGSSDRRSTAAKRVGHLACRSDVDQSSSVDSSEAEDIALSHPKPLGQELTLQL